MTKEEVIRLLVLIESVYSYCITKSDTVQQWFEYCHLMDYEKVMQNLHTHIRKSPFPPAIEDLAAFTDTLEQSSKEGCEWIQDVSNPRNSAWMHEYSLITTENF